MVKSVIENVKNNHVETKMLTKRSIQSQKLGTKSSYPWNVLFVNIVIAKNDQITPKHHGKSFHPLCVHPTATCNIAGIPHGACSLDLQPISLIWEEFLGRTLICTLDILVINSDQIKVSAGQYHATILWALVFTSLRSHAQMLVSVRMQPRKDCYSWGRGGLTKTEFWVN